VQPEIKRQHSYDQIWYHSSAFLWHWLLGHFHIFQSRWFRQLQQGIRHRPYRKPNLRQTFLVLNVLSHHHFPPYIFFRHLPSYFGNSRFDTLLSLLRKSSSPLLVNLKWWIG